MNYNIKLNLSKIEQSFVAAIKGRTTTKKCLCIPLDAMGLYVGEKGIYLDITAIELQTQKFGQSHFLKVSMPKEAYQQLTQEERERLPIVGNMKVIERQAADNPDVQTAQETDIVPDDDMSIDDLPF